MKIMNLVAVMLFSSVCLTAEDPVDINSSEFAQKVILKIESIIEGAELNTFRSNISPGAYIIHKKRYENFYALWNNIDQRNEFINNHDVEIEFANQRISEDLKSAYLILKLKSVSSNEINWHTIYYEIDDGNMKILSWHKS